MMKILYVVADGYNEYNSSNYRASIPGSALMAQNAARVQYLGVHDWMRQTERGKVHCEWADIIIIQRVAIAEGIDNIRHWTARGTAVLVDFDDAYDLIRPDNAAYEFWGEGVVQIAYKDGRPTKRKTLDVHPVEQFKHGLRAATGLSTPSHLLCERWGQHTKASLYIPNYLDTERYDVPKRTDSDWITIGWGGSLSHLPSFEMPGVVEALRQVCLEHPNARMLLIGDKRVAGLLKGVRLKFNPYVKWSDWPSMLARYDIGLAPLYGTYDACRSDLKVREYLQMGIPFVATKGRPYEHFFDKVPDHSFVDQGNIDVCETPNAEEWYNGIVEQMRNLDRKKTQIDFPVDVDYIVNSYRRVIWLAKIYGNN